MTFITAVSARAQTQQDMIIRLNPQTFAKKIAGIEERFMCHAPCLSIIIIYIIQKVSASHNYNIYILVYLTYF